MQIGFDAKRLYQNTTGLGNYSRTLVQNLAIVAPQYHYHLYSNRLSATYAAFDANSSFERHLPPSSQWSAAWWRSVGIRSQLQSDGIQIYHGLSNELPFGIGQDATKSVVTIHDVLFRRLPHTYPWVDRQIYQYKVKQACQQADKIIAISENTKQDIIHYYGTNPDKIEVLYQACLPAFYEVLVPNSSLLEAYNLPAKYLLVVGGVGERKNLKLVLQAQALLPTSARLPIVLVGRGKPKGILAKLMQQALATQQLIWLQNIEETATLIQLYLHAAALVYPSLYEGFGLPIVEALLCQTPVIAANNSSLPEAGGKAAWYLEENTPQSLANLIQTVVQNDNLCQQKVELGYTFAKQKFDPAQLTTQLLTLYESLLR